MKKLIYILLILLVNCKTATYVCDEQQEKFYGEEYYYICNSLREAQRKKRQINYNVSRGETHSIVIKADNKYAVIIPDCDLIEARYFFNLFPVFVANDTSRIKKTLSEFRDIKFLE
jgi:hypothetical protein